MELKVRVIIVLVVLNHIVSILAPFVVSSWYLIERLDAEVVTRNVRLNKRIAPLILFLIHV